MSGYLVFDIGGHELAAPLTEVREVVRIDRLDPMPGLEPPVTGLMHLRGRPLPVCDLRRGDGVRTATEPGTAGTAGDVVLLGLADGSLLGVAVDRVLAVVGADVLVPVDEADVPTGFPPYVVGVMRRAERPSSTVFLVAMGRLVDALAPAPV
jgi:chemotaxis signal transduction protein